MKRILAFEPDKELATELKAAFWQYGCDLDVVDDSKAGLDKARANQPDLILLTIELPRENGFSICSVLKRNKTLKKIPLVLLSSECTEETFFQHRKMQTAADGYLRKPFELGALLKEVDSLIELQPGGLDQSVLNSAPSQELSVPTEGALQVAQQVRANFQSSKPSPLPLMSPPPASLADAAPASPAPSASRASLRRKMIVLWSPDSNLRGQCFSFAEEDASSITFGREVDNSIVVQDPAVSANHMLVEWKGSKITVRDFGSGSGTFINDELISHQELNGGENVRIGETTLLYLRGLDVESQLEWIIRELAEFDPHIRVYSYLRGREKLQNLLEKARQDMTPLSLAVVSIDNLNRTAYRYGDRIAQKVLEEVAATLRSTTRTGVVSRDFGAGFLVVMPNTAENIAVGKAEGWRFEVGVSEIIAGDYSVTSTLSVGVLEWREEWNTKDFLRRAYKLLSDARANGGNQVVSRKLTERSAAPP